MINIKVLCDSANLWQFDFQDPATPSTIGFFACLLFTSYVVGIVIGIRNKRLYDLQDLISYKAEVACDATEVGTYQYEEQQVPGKKRKRFLIHVNTNYSSLADLEATLNNLMAAYTSHQVYTKRVTHVLMFCMQSSPTKPSLFGAKQLPTSIENYGHCLMEPTNCNLGHVHKFFNTCLGNFEASIQKRGYKNYQGNKILLVIDVIS